MPLFLERGTREHGNDFERKSRLRMDLRISSSVNVPSVKYLSRTSSSCSAMYSTTFARCSRKLLIDRRALQGCSNVRSRIYKRLVPKFLDFKNFELGSEGFFEPTTTFCSRKLIMPMKLSSRRGETGGGRDEHRGAGEWCGRRGQNRRPCDPSCSRNRCAGRDTCRLGAKRFPIAAARRRQSQHANAPSSTRMNVRLRP